MFWEDGLNALGRCGRRATVEEAGGRELIFTERPLNFYTPKVLASNGLFHNAMMGVLGT